MSSVIGQPESIDISLFRAMVDNSTAALVAVDMKGRCIYANPACQEVTGYAPDELLGEVMHNLLHHSYPDGRPYPSHECSLYKAMALIQPIRNLEELFFRKDGSPFHALCNSNPIVCNGVLHGAVVEIRDISEQRRTEEALKESEERFRSMADQAPVLIAMSNRDTDLVYFNKAWQEYTGRSLEEELAFGWINGVHPEDRETTLETYLQAHARQAGFEVEYRLRRHDGQYRWMYSKVAPRTTLSGEFAGYIGVIMDIHDRKETEMALLESEARFRAMADSAPLFVWLSDDTGRLSYANKTWTDFLDQTPQEVIEFGMRDAVHPDDIDRHMQEYRDAFNRREAFTIECRIFRHDGALRWLLNKGAPLFLPDGGLAGYIGTSVDITDRRVTEERLQDTLKREQLIRRLVTVINQSFDIDHILRTIAEELGRYLDSDRASVSRYSVRDGKLFFDMSAQYAREGCLPADPEDIRLITDAMQHLSPAFVFENQEQIVNISDQTLYLEYLRREMEKLPELPGLPVDRLIEIVKKYGVRSALRLNIIYRGVPYGSISVQQCLNDRTWTDDEIELIKVISEHAGSAIYQAELFHQAEETARREKETRQELEEYARKLETSNNELESFATIVSHDLQAPLRKIQIFADHLRSTSAQHLGEEALDDLNRIEKSARRMQDLVLDLLTLSRVTRTGKPFRKVDLARIIQEVRDDLREELQASGGTILCGDLPCLTADGTQISQLFQNLIQNSLKFRKPETPPVVQISAVTGEHCCEIRVADNGIGFKPEYAEKVFEIFQRLHGESRYPGTGIGLSICKRIVERHGGTIEAQSQPQEGAVFTIRLPLAAIGPETA